MTAKSDLDYEVRNHADPVLFHQPYYANIGWDFGHTHCQLNQHQIMYAQAFKSICQYRDPTIAVSILYLYIMLVLEVFLIRENYKSQLFSVCAHTILFVQQWNSIGAI